ncbi:hypothetical protein PR048_013821 [Dryococelus australis]|uniref:Uncharacterized protein n=1 Tax=Dryococelus australis TaxID=614101 RepID=A0ABQ9HU37_9NEOP|nr:hypothetical protein PR048_013821 [Dryococelus australis]
MEKLLYLKTSVLREPLSLIQFLPLTPDNYEVACTLLGKWYNNRCLIGSHNFDALINVSHITSSYPSSLLQLLATIQEHTSALKVLVVSDETWDPLLLHLFEGKLDRNLRKEWELTIFLYLWLEGRSTRLHKNVLVHMSQSLVASAGEELTDSELCQGSCTLSKCSQFSDLSQTQRFEKVKGYNLCINCLRTSYKLKKCPSKMNCHQCNLRYQILLHFNKDILPETEGLSGNANRGSTEMEAVT